MTIKTKLLLYMSNIFCLLLCITSLSYASSENSSDCNALLSDSMLHDLHKIKGDKTRHRAKKAICKAQQKGKEPEKKGGSAPISCAAILCLAPYIGLGNTGTGDEAKGCDASIGAYFAIQIYDMEGFDASLTKAARRIFLMTCNPLGGENQKLAQQENDKVGTDQFPP